MAGTNQEAAETLTISHRRHHLGWGSRGTPSHNTPGRTALCAPLIIPLHPAFSTQQQLSQKSELVMLLERRNIPRPWSEDLPVLWAEIYWVDVEGGVCVRFLAFSLFVL